MKRSVWVAVLGATLLVAATRPARATEVGYSRTFGLGVALGDPTGIVAKLWLSNTNALDFGFGFHHIGWRRCDRFDTNCDYAYRDYSFNVDYLWQSNLVKGPLQLDWHIGLGGRAYFVGDNRYAHDVNLAVRAPIGLDMMFRNPSFLELYFEIAPALYLLDLDLGLEGSLGARAYF
jgi:hypothetical protein